MFESVLTISLTGLIAGFIFAMPIAGPISILIVSNALHGRRRYSNLISLGAAISDFIFIFIAVYGISSLYSYYKPAVPYLLIAGSLFFIFLGYKLFRKPVDIDHFEEKTHMTDMIRDSGTRGVYTGFMVNMLNPTQFIGGLISSFFVISLISSVGLNTGGLETVINKNVKEIGTINGENLEEKIPGKIRNFREESPDRSQDYVKYPSYFHLLISVIYAFTLSLGSLFWFYFLAWILSRYRRLINIKILNSLIKGFALALAVIGFYFGYLGVRELI